MNKRVDNIETRANELNNAIEDMAKEFDQKLRCLGDRVSHQQHQALTMRVISDINFGIKNGIVRQVQKVDEILQDFATLSVWATNISITILW